MKILVTGGLGFVGGRLVRKLANESQVIVSSRSKKSVEELNQHGVSSCLLHTDLLNQGNFPSDVHTVVHLAALNERDCVQFPSEAIRVNIDETRILVENAILHGVKQFVYLSTAHVYGTLAGVVTEQTLPQPIHPYAITHKAAEDYVFSASKKIQTAVVRLSNSFGAPVLPTVNRWTLLANDLSRQAIEKGKLILQSAGSQYRDFVTLSDVEVAIESLIRLEGNRQFDVYNLGAGKSLSVIDIAQLIQSAYFDLFGKSISIETPLKSKFEESTPFRFDISRLSSEGINPQNDFQKELRQLLIFCATHFKRPAS